MHRTAYKFQVNFGKILENKVKTLHTSQLSRRFRCVSGLTGFWEMKGGMIKPRAKELKCGLERCVFYKITVVGTRIRVSDFSLLYTLALSKITAAWLITTLTSQ